MNDKSRYDVFSFLYVDDILEKLEIGRIPATVAFTLSVHPLDMGKLKKIYLLTTS
jgi:hypothetical protein